MNFNIDHHKDVAPTQINRKHEEYPKGWRIVLEKEMLRAKTGLTEVEKQRTKKKGESREGKKKSLHNKTQYSSP